MVDIFGRVRNDGQQSADLDGLAFLHENPAAPKDSTSTVTLSVSISMIISCFATGSPTFLSHFVKMPSSIVSPSGGMTTRVIITIFPPY
jgi:hypothetical protein